MERTTLFVEVVLPLPLPGFYTYRVPYELNDSVKKGVRVVVQFGQKKIYTALVYRIHEEVPNGFVPKYILSVLDEKPIVNSIQFDFWKWVAQYYMCRIGEVMNAALPSSLKLASESCIVLHPEFDRNFDALHDKEFLIAEALDIRQKLSLAEISDILDQKKIIPIINTLIEKKVVLLEEELFEKYKPKKELCVKLTEKYQDENSLNELLTDLNQRAFKQVKIVMAYLQMSRFAEISVEHISRPKLLEMAGASAAQLHALVEKGVFETYENTISRLKDFENSAETEDIQLSEVQQQALTTIKKHLESHDVVLLHGITSSGKTEIYIKLIKEALQQQKQVLFLLPEIALTAQIINRLRKYFGKRVGVYHSKYNRDERVEIWNRIVKDDEDSDLLNSYDIILGARSAVFLPFSRLGLVIVDEEHDTSFKQNEPAPRYNGRDAAIYLSHLHGAKTILGSATPSVETYFNALTAKYGLAEINVRYGNIEYPDIELVNLKEQTKQKRMKSIFSDILFQQIKEVMQNHEQVILFQNRRGFSTRVECNDCRWVPSCKYCDVTLVYHKHINLLKCHYCGYSTPVPHGCPACKSTQILTKGVGTEQIEEDTSLMFPENKVVRMDLDTTRSKNAYLEILNDFEDQKTQILIGTQMVTKGLDFDHVAMVGILNADNMLNYPDFRSHERSYQLMSQVSGRAGRRSKRGKVIIQTYNPQHPIIQLVLQNNYAEMCNLQLVQRRQFNYPPYCKLIRITLKHYNSEALNAAATYLAHNIRLLFPKKVYGPEYPVVSRIKNLYLKNILLKLDRDATLLQNKLNILEEIDAFQKKFTTIKVHIDVDPL
jgi:primosomal protein N' (replication factor Y) (superfamily II helicase)